MSRVRGAAGTTPQKFDDFRVGIDNNGDGDYVDGGDRMLAADDFSSNAVTLSYDYSGNLTPDASPRAKLAHRKAMAAAAGGRRVRG